MEFGYFIALIGLICLVIGLVVNKKGMLEPKNPNCPEQIAEARITKKYKTVFIVVGSCIMLIGVFLVIFG